MTSSLQNVFARQEVLLRNTFKFQTNQYAVRSASTVTEKIKISTGRKTIDFWDIAGSFVHIQNMSNTVTACVVDKKPSDGAMQILFSAVLQQFPGS